VAVAFAALGGVVSVALSSLVFLAEHDIARRLVDETLVAELEDLLARRARNPTSLPPQTATLRGYIAAPGSAALPAAVAALAPGTYDVELEGVPHRVLVHRLGDERAVLLFNETRQRARERRFAAYLAAAALGVTLLSAGTGWWLSRRVVRPLTELARAVRRAGPDRPPRLPGSPDREDEVAELARAFDRYVERLHAFVDRERDFAADASHELRTPLAVVAGAAEVLADDPALTPAQQARVARIRRAATQMSQVIGALLLLAREDDVAPAEPVPVDRVIEETVARLAPDAAARHMRIDVTIEARPSLDVPEPLLASVVGNLLRNAVAHSVAASVRVHLRPDALVVADRGVGIPADVLTRVFDRHFRGPASEGAGIGLALARRICERLGWTLELHSLEGEGTTAVLRFLPYENPAGGA